MTSRISVRALATSPVNSGATIAVRNGLWNASATVLVALAGAAGSILIVRSLTVEAYGAVSYYLWLAHAVSIAGTLAFPSALVKISSELRGNQRRAEGEILSRWVAIGLIGVNVVIGAAILTWALSTPGPDRIYRLLIAAFVAPNALTAVLRATLWGSERYRPVSVTLGISAAIQLGLVVVGHIAGWGPHGFVAALLSTNVVQAFALAWVPAGPLRTGRGFIPMTFPEPATLRRYFAFALPATLLVVSEVVVWQRSELFFLNRFRELPEVGFFNLAATVSNVFLTAGWALVGGFYPAISRDYGEGDWPRIQEKVRQGLIVATLFAVPLTFGGWATLHTVVSLLYTPKMAPAVAVVHVLLVGLLPGVVAGLLSLMIKAVGGVWLHVRLGAVALTVDIVLALLLVPRFGALGAAIANTSCQIVYAVLLLVRVRRLYGVSVPWGTLAGIAAAGAGTAFLVPAALQWWVSGWMGLLGAVILTGCLYGVAVWRFGYLRALRIAA